MKKNGHQKKMDFRGGTRPGAGRKSIGLNKRVAITLPAEEWAEIEKKKNAGDVESYADYFRKLHFKGANTKMDSALNESNLK